MISSLVVDVKEMNNYNLNYKVDFFGAKKFIIYSSFYAKYTYPPDLTFEISWFVKIKVLESQMFEISTKSNINP